MVYLFVIVASLLFTDIAAAETSALSPTIAETAGKSGAGDAAAICEAVTGPTMCFVAIKTVEQHGARRDPSRFC